MTERFDPENMFKSIWDFSENLEDALKIGLDITLNNSFSSNLRSIYNIGDTLTVEDQSRLYPVCNGSGAYQTGDSFSFSDLNGSVNGGDYKITLISMNATW